MLLAEQVCSRTARGQQVTNHFPEEFKREKRPLVSYE